MMFIAIAHQQGSTHWWHIDRTKKKRTRFSSAEDFSKIRGPLDKDGPSRLDIVCLLKRPRKRPAKPATTLTHERRFAGNDH